MNEYKEVILRGVNSNTPPQEIIDNLYHKEFMKYLRYGKKPQVAYIIQAIKEVFYLEISNNQDYFDFVDAVANGRTLLVGEGNFSFSLSIANEISKPQNILATTIEVDNISDFTKNNIQELTNLGAKVMLGIDGTQLHKTFADYEFDNIIFQFPNTGNIKAIEGRHSNFILLRDFLTSAKHILSQNGKVVITIVDSSYYQGAFQIEEAAKITGYKDVQTFKFNPLLFADYIHTMTTQNKSALDESDNCQTIVFSV